jgi:hypothetical protein
MTHHKKAGLKPMVAMCGAKMGWRPPGENQICLKKQNGKESFFKINIVVKIY